MRSSSIFVAVLFAPLTLFAQTSSSSGPHVVVMPPAGQACPVGFSVNRKPDGAIVWTDSAGLPASHGQGVDINFAAPRAQIASVDIVVHGYPAGLRIIPATSSAPSEITETFHLAASASQPLLHPFIWTAHMVAISWVELTRLDYADSTTWQSSTPRQCSAAPSLFVPVSSLR